MEENNKDQGKELAHELKSPTLTKLENFWYHYKWQTIFTVCGVFVLLICTLQMCSRESGDISFFHVGQSAMGGAKQHEIGDSVRDVLDEEDAKVSFITHYIVSTDVLEEMETVDAAYLANTSYENAQAFRIELAASEAYICLFSRDVYDLSMKWYPLKRADSGELYSPLYRPLSDFGLDASIEPYDDYAVYLCDTPLYELPGFSTMPRDTLLCMRQFGYTASAIGGSGAKKLYERHEDVFARLLAYKGEND